MTKRIYFYLSMLLLFSGSFAIGQTSKTVDYFRNKLEIINDQLTEAYLAKDINKLTKYYGENTVCMPEYHKALYTKNQIYNYYQQWLDSTSINTYKRTIFKVEQFKDYLIEIGTFSNKFSKADSSMFAYEGKYLNVWKIDNAENLVLISEIWGANNPVNRSIFSFANNNELIEIPKPNIEKKIEREVNKRNQLIGEVVTKREGEKHAIEFFTQDAIYLTYDSPMFIGMENIKPYFIKHEKPGDVSIDSLDLKSSKMIDLGRLIIEYGYYYVAVSWDHKKGSAIVTGKSTNIWIRDKNGKLMIYRQMVNHD